MCSYVLYCTSTVSYYTDTISIVYYLCSFELGAVGWSSQVAALPVGKLVYADPIMSARSRGRSAAGSSRRTPRPPPSPPPRPLHRALRVPLPPHLRPPSVVHMLLRQRLALQRARAWPHGAHRDTMRPSALRFARSQSANSIVYSYFNHSYIWLFHILYSKLLFYWISVIIITEMTFFVVCSLKGRCECSREESPAASSEAEGTGRVGCGERRCIRNCEESWSAGYRFDDSFVDMCMRCTTIRIFSMSLFLSELLFVLSYFAHL